MKLQEVASDPLTDSNELIGLIQFLRGRAKDTSARLQISQDAFIKMAGNLDIQITPDSLVQLAAEPPLSNLLEPIDPASGVIVFKGGEPTQVNMPVNKAQDIVAGMAKKANPLT